MKSQILLRFREGHEVDMLGATLRDVGNSEFILLAEAAECADDTYVAPSNISGGQPAFFSHGQL